MIFNCVFCLKCEYRLNIFHLTTNCSRKKKNYKVSLETKTRQRLSRNKRRKAERKQLQRGLYHTVMKLKEEKECLSQKIALELRLKTLFQNVARV